MILQQDHWHFGYEQIVNDCRVGEDGAPKTALLLCNADVDAMACARILSFMLRSDGVNYQLLPCTNYAALEKNLSTVQIDDIRAIVLLNFGASRNLTRLFDNAVHEDVKVYVMDCRKPVHLANIYAGDNIVIFMDAVQGEELPSDGDNLSGNEQSSSEDEDDDSDESDDDDDSGIDATDDEGDDEEEASFDDVIGGIDARERRNESVDEQDPAYDGEDETVGEEASERRTRDLDDAESLEQNAKRRKTNDDVVDDTGKDGSDDGEKSDEEARAGGDDDIIGESQDPREMHRMRRKRLESYYTTGSFFGSPAAFIAYRLAMQLRFGDQSDLLWLACVGVTDAYLHARLDLSGYTALTMELRRLCLRLFPNDRYEQVSNTVYAEELLGLTRGDGQQDRTKITFNENGRIIAEKDYRFFLLRHSSLFESMVQSDYISTRLQAWNKRGMHRLQELLAKMGYPLDECKQPFAFMKPSLRRRLQEKIMENSQVNIRLTTTTYL